MDSTTGRHIAGVEHLKQSIADIITTPLGSADFSGAPYVQPAARPH